MTTFSAGGHSVEDPADELPRGIDLPPYSLWSRVPAWEPRGRWLHDRPQIEWPDAFISATWAPWLIRAVLLVGLVLGQAVMPGGWGPHMLAAALTVALAGWIEWWQRWDLTPLALRLLAFAGQFALTAAIIAVSPLGGLVVWSHYMICGTFFTGPLLLGSLVASSVLISAVQVGGFDHLSGSWPLTAGLFVLDIVIGLVTIGFANKREEAVLRRHAANQALVAEQQRNSDLQEQLLDQARTAGMRAERARLARELHDTVAQGFVAVVTQLEAIDDTHLEATTQRRLANAKALGRQGLGEARRAVNALAPLTLDEAELPDALQAIVRDWSRINHIPATVTVSGQPRESNAEPAIVRVVQEALSNIARHARAGRATVSLDYLEDQVMVNIHDDGRGFDPASTPRPSRSGGHGLPGMGERIRLAGGTLSVDSQPAQGCVISAAVPG